MKIIISKLNKPDQQKIKSPKKRHMNKILTYLHIKESHQSAKLKAIVYMQIPGTDLCMREELR